MSENTRIKKVIVSQREEIEEKSEKEKIIQREVDFLKLKKYLLVWLVGDILLERPSTERGWFCHKRGQGCRTAYSSLLRYWNV